MYVRETNRTKECNLQGGTEKPEYCCDTWLIASTMRAVRYRHVAFDLQIEKPCQLLPTTNELPHTFSFSPPPPPGPPRNGAPMCQDLVSCFVKNVKGVEGGGEEWGKTIR